MAKPETPTRLARRTWPRVWIALVLGQLTSLPVCTVILTEIMSRYPLGTPDRLVATFAGSCFILWIPFNLLIALILPPLLLRRPLPAWVNRAWMVLFGLALGFIPSLIAVHLFLLRAVPGTPWRPVLTAAVMHGLVGVITALFLRQLALRRVPRDISAAFQ